MPQQFIVMVLFVRIEFFNDTNLILEIGVTFFVKDQVSTRDERFFSPK